MVKIQVWLRFITSFITSERNLFSSCKCFIIWLVRLTIFAHPGPCKSCLSGVGLIAFFLFLFQALAAISEVGDLLQLKYSRREQPLPSLGWMSEESLLQDWATRSHPTKSPLPFLLWYPPFSSEPVLISLGIGLSRTHQNLSLRPGPPPL